MKNVIKVFAVLAGLTLSFAGRGMAQGDLPAGWSASGVGIKNGTQQYDNGTFTLTASGRGMLWPFEESHFVYKTIPAGGDFKIIGRLASFTGGKGTQAGLMMRQGVEPGSPCGMIMFAPQSFEMPAYPNRFYVMSRGERGGEVSNISPLGPPIWFQIVRIGDNFAAWRSSDGQDWAPISESSGQAFMAKGPLQIGMFVAGGEAPVTATFDSITIKTPPEQLMAYKSSWLGNTAGTNSLGHVSGMLAAMYVSPDGKVYANAAFEEAAQTSQIYKDGKVLAPIGRSYNNGANEGSITATDTHTYLYAQYCDSFHGLVQADPLGTYGSFTPVFTTTPIAGPGDQNCHVSGMATFDDELYVSNNYTNQIMVLKIPYVPHARTMGDTNFVTKEHIDTTGVENPAPEAVYQSQRYGYIGYDFKLDPAKTYKVRLHFAEVKPENQEVGKHYFTAGVVAHTNQLVGDYDPVAKGGKWKASVITFDGVQPNGDGKISIEALPSRNTGDHDAGGAINGIEIINPDGTPVIRYNCGGSSIPGTDWVGESPEIPERAFSFTRPGPIAVDKRGMLWIVQQGREYPTTANFDYKPGWAAVKCYDKNGVFQNKEITDLKNPTAICYDEAQDRILIAENGPDQNIRIYTGLTGTPKCTSTFGAKGGIFSGKTPGVMYDANDGGWARFYGLTGVGVDAVGNIYVGSNFGPLHTDIRALKPDGSLVWKVQGMEFCNVGDFDASVDSSDVWTTDKHYKMDWRSTQPGGEWSLYSYGMNHFAPYKYRISYHNSCAIYRKMGPKKTPFIFAAGQGFLGPIEIRRFDGEQLIPCGFIPDAGGKIWLDQNGDGIEQPEEVQIMTGPGANGICTFDVADNGDIYLGSGQEKVVRKLTFTGINDKGAPQYSGITSDPVIGPIPAYYGNSWERGRIRYQSATDTMYFMGFPTGQARVPDTRIVRIDKWNTNPTVKYEVSLPTPRDNPNFIANVDDRQPWDGFIYMAFDVANDKIFACEVQGIIHVLDTNTGKQVFKILPGPEIGGGAAWEDNGMGIRAHFNKGTGSYYIITENSGWAAKLNLYRWKP